MSDSAAMSNVGGFKITSPTFVNNGTVPKSMIGIAVPQCNGGNLSPILNWSNQPAGTKSLALVLFDETANFGHWGIYNMRARADRLPQGVKPGNIAGLWAQVFNDAGIQGYFGPCPPPGIVHHYVFTIYALNTTLTLQNNPGLNPPNIEALLYAMIGHVIGRASITGLLRSP
jgi:Raf kinase inhibitor-like YbhB/YbcL family protein